MNQKYSREIYLFILKNAAGRSSSELAELVNKKFGNLFTTDKMRSFKSHYGIKSGVNGGSFTKGKSFIFTPDEEQFIKDNIKAGVSTKELTELVNKTFNKDFTFKQIRNYKSRHHLKNGNDPRFKKGSVPKNKGQKMSAEAYQKCKKTMFKKGSKPHNYKPVGSERIDSRYGYTWIKIADPKRWVLKHSWLWQQATGKKVPKGYFVTFLDGNKQNFDISNLALISRAENARLNKNKLRSEFGEVTESNINVVRLNTKIKEIKDKRAIQKREI